MKRLIILWIILATTVVACGGGGGGEPEGLGEAGTANVSAINAAVDSITALNFVQLDGSQQIDQTITINGNAQTSELTQEVTAKATFNGGNLNAVDMTTVQDLDSPDASGTLTIDLIYFNDETFVRARSALGIFASNEYRSGFVNTKREPRGMPGLETYDFEAMRNTVVNPVGLRLTPDSVTSANQLREESVNGETARVIEVVVNTAGLLSEGSEFRNLLALMDFESMGLDAEAIANNLAQGSSMTLTYWIGKDFPRLYRIDSSMNVNLNLGTIVEGANGTIENTTTGSYTYKGFNEPVSISPPAEGS